jgi:hypothetical protein
MMGEHVRVWMRTPRSTQQKEWPHFSPPKKNCEFSVFDVMRAQPGVERTQLA